MFFHIAESSNEDRVKPVFNMADIFLLIEANKEFLRIESFSLSQTTLEQIFMTFAQTDNTLI